jgi:lipopolysaccharide export system protein LptA
MPRFFLRRVYRLSFLLVILCINVLLSQESKTIFLKNADDLKGTEKNGEQIRELIGNVELTQGNIRLKCDHAIQYYSSNKVEVSGNIVVYQDTLRLFSDNSIYYGDTRTTVSPGKVRITDGRLNLTAKSGYYDANKKRANFFRDVIVSDLENTIYSDTMVYYRDSSKVCSFGNVKVVSKENNTTAYSDSLEYYRRTKYSKMMGNPELIQMDTSGTKNNKSDSIKIDTLFIKAKLLISDRNVPGGTLYAVDSVRLLRDNLNIACNNLSYFVRDSIFILEKEPVIWYETNQIFSDSMTIFLLNRSIEKINASGNAFMLSEVDSISKNAYNQIMGDTLQLLFSGNKLDSVLAVGKSLALYFITDSAGINSAYKSTGEKIKIELVDKKVKEVKVLFGVESFYYPYSMIYGKENVYNLPRFKLLPYKPKREDYYKIKNK